MKTILPLVFAAALIPTVLTPSSAAQPAFTVLHQFRGAPDGTAPVGVIVGANGRLYGTTEYGGAHNFGTVFELHKPSEGEPRETVLYNFTQRDDGGTPAAGLVLGANGVLYGSTYLGGTHASGTVFEMTPPAAPDGSWTETVLYNFQGGSDYGPNSGLVMGAHGELYGTVAGYPQPPYSCEVFELQPPASPGAMWTENVLFTPTSEAPVNGCGFGGLALGADGALYGANLAVGNSGTVFALIPPPSSAPSRQSWTATVLYSFTGGVLGQGPYGPVAVGPDGVVYGVTNYGGSLGWGTVFALAPPSALGGSWTKTDLYNFADNGDGATPYAGLTMGVDGALYGLTLYGGAANGPTVFKLQRPSAPGGVWNESVLYNFTTHNVLANGPVFVDRARNIYGTTFSGPGSNGNGIVYRIKP